MAERKVFNKYIPPDFDPSILPKGSRPQNNQIKIRSMLPMTICCTKCGEFIGKGTKYNCRMEEAKGKSYLGLKVWRFYMKCTGCSIELTFLTDPENDDYVCENNCRRTYEPWRIEQDAQKVEKLIKESEKHDQLKQLETKMQQQKYQMDLMDTVDQLQNINKKHAFVDHDKILDTIHGTKRSIEQMYDNNEIDSNNDQSNGIEDAQLLEYRAKKRLKLNPQIANIKYKSNEENDNGNNDKTKSDISNENENDKESDESEMQDSDIDNPALEKKFEKYKKEKKKKEKEKEKMNQMLNEKNKNENLAFSQSAAISLNNESQIKYDFSSKLTANTQPRNDSKMNDSNENNNQSGIVLLKKKKKKKHKDKKKHNKDKKVKKANS